MKTIKVFLASSEELTEERLQFDSLFNHLNRIFRPRGLYLELSKWEYLDSSMGPKHKQEEYNEELKTCEMCIVMFWTRFGEYTNEELMTAYNELKEGRNPRKLFVFFKEPAEMSEELKNFKETFDKALGHFYCKFENVDSMRLHFLLQLEAYNNIEFKGHIKVEDSKVTVLGSTMVNLDNIPFAAKNKEYKRLKDEIIKTESEIRAFESVLAAGPNEVISSLLSQKRTDLYHLKQELSKHEKLLFDTALRIVQQQGEKISERMARAIEAFEDGRASEANTILDEALHDARTIREDICKTKKILKHQQENAAVSISELMLKASVVLADNTMTIDDRINAAEELYEEAYTLANECNYAKDLYIQLLKEYTSFLSTNAKYDKCLKLRIELLDIIISVMGENHEEAAKIYNNLGSVYDSYGDYEKALEHYKKSLKIRLALFGESHPDVSASYNNIGHTYDSCGEYNIALKYHEKALKISIDCFGENHPDVATSYNNLGSVYNSLGEYEKAMDFYVKGLKIIISHVGEDHIDVAKKYNNIGYTYVMLGDFSKALEYYEKALKNILKAKGGKHHEVATLYSNIGHAYNGLEEYEKALKYYERALTICIDSLGPNHTDVASKYNNLGTTYYHLGDNAKALEYYKKALKIKCDTLGDHHPDLATIYSNIGHIYDSAEEYAKAVKYYEKALKIGINRLGENHPDVVDSYYEIGSAYDSLGEHSKAIEYFEKILGIRLATYGDSHLEVALAYNNAGYTYYLLGEYDKAIAYIKKALKINRDIRGEEDPDTKQMIDAINYISEKKSCKS